MAIIHPHHKKRRPRKPTEAERKLRAEWERIVASHAKPLEGGVKAKGKLPSVTGAKVLTKPSLTVKPVRVRPDDAALVPSLPMGIGAGTKPAVDPIGAEKHALKARLGQIYNKGAPQYLTDADLAEQKTGNHRRR